MSEIPQDPKGDNVPDEKKLPYGENGYFITEKNNNVPDPVKDSSPKPKKEKKVSLFTFVLSTVALVLAAVMTTYTLTSVFYKKQLAQANAKTPAVYNEYISTAYPFVLFSRFIDKYTFEDTSEEERMAVALKAYVAATGDKYAYYYTADEYAMMKMENAGESEGIGINIIYTIAEIDGQEHLVIRVINVMSNSPASESGMKVGDLIYGVGIGEDIKTVTELGHEVALTALKGAAGTKAVFTVKRPDPQGGYDEIPFEIERRKVTSESVYYRVHTEDPTVGVIKILQFDLTTPQNFSDAMDALIANGCTNFIFDVRYNPGGDLESISAVLSGFLNKDDVIIRTEYKGGYEKINKVQVVEYDEDDPYYGCSVSEDDIGKYKKDEYRFAVLCNGSSASAAELFTATFRDYGVGTIVGTTTYGKGIMQSIINLSDYGYGGALKLTVAKYYSGANGGYNDGYDGVGIVPDVTVELSEAAANKNIYELTDAEDNQLAAAVESLKNKK